VYLEHELQGKLYLLCRHSSYSKLLTFLLDNADFYKEVKEVVSMAYEGTNVKIEVLPSRIVEGILLIVSTTFRG